EELAMVDVEQWGGGAGGGARGGGRGGGAGGRPRAADLVVPGVAIRHRDEQHMVALPGVQRRHPAGLEIAVVGVRAECHYALSFLCHDCLLAIACRAYCTAR